MAQNEMRAMRGMPLRVRSMEGLGRIAVTAELKWLRMGSWLICFWLWLGDFCGPASSVTRHEREAGGKDTGEEREYGGSGYGE